MSCHESSVEVSELSGLNGEGGLSLDAGVGLGLFGGGWGRAFGLADHGAGEFLGVSWGHKVS